MQVVFRNTPIVYTEKGSGAAVVLLHGYLESSEIWGNFLDLLAQNFRVISIDLPGHGLSGTIEDVHSMKLMAEAVNTVLDALDLKKVFIVGHSLGGYVAQAFLEKYPWKLFGICLFHSSPLADTAARKVKREKEIDFIEKGRFHLICSFGIEDSFAPENVERLKKEVERAKQIALRTPEKGAIAALRGMKERPDRQFLLKETTVPLFFILGKHDANLPADLLLSIASRTHTGESLLLNHTAHMGFVEEPDICREVLSSFILQHTQKH